MAELGLFDMFLPDGYCTWMNISDPLYVGDYRPEYHHERGRLKLGRISFAGADAARNPWSQSALQQGWRAAKEQLEFAGKAG